MSDILNSEVRQPDPGVSIGRSTFTGLSHSLKTDFQQGDLCPIFCEEILPGDTFEVSTSMLVRMATPVFPVMDNAVIDIWWFYCPTRLVWDYTKQFYGENTVAPWVQQTEYTVPQLKFNHVYVDDTGNGYCAILRGSLMNRLGIPTTLYPGYSAAVKSDDYCLSVSDIPNRCYRLIWNEFFRDENVQYPVVTWKDNNDRYYDPVGGGYGHDLLKVCRLHDYFTDCLPGPQKSLTPVPASLLVDHVPVDAIGGTLDEFHSFSSSSSVDPIHFAYKAGSTWSHNVLSGNHALFLQASGSQADKAAYSYSDKYSVTPDNLYLNPSQGDFATVITLRQAFAVQRMLELQARSGSRYREQLRSFFHVDINDLTLQVPEYLGGTRVPINIDQVLQTSSTDVTSPQGNTAGYSLTTDTDNSFIKSFTEPGFLFGLAAVRVHHTYPGQCRPFWFRKRRYDFYYPQFANLSEQPVFKKYLNATGIAAIDNRVFGYQPAWQDYRECPNQLSGQFSPIVYNEGFTVNDEIVEQPSPLTSAWTFSDYYDMGYEIAVNREAGTLDPDLISDPSLSESWMMEPFGNVAQTIAVPTEPQFIGDFFFNVKATRPMPVTSIPGLIDHH